jgi:protease I
VGVFRWSADIPRAAGSAAGEREVLRRKRARLRMAQGGDGADPFALIRDQPPHLVYHICRSKEVCMTRVLLVAGDATESLDTWYPYLRLREEGVEVHIGAPAKKMLKSVVHDFEPGWETYVERPGYHIPADIAFADVDPGDYDGIILSGGRAPEYLRNDRQLQKIVRHFVDGKKPIAALCHGVLILAAIDAIRGRTISTYQALVPDVESAGGKFKDTEVMVDGNLVTSRTWMDLPFFMREFLKVLNASRKSVAA